MYVYFSNYLWREDLGVEMESSGPWPVTNIHTPSGDAASLDPCSIAKCDMSSCNPWVGQS